MDNLNKNIPSPEQVRLIFNNAYRGKVYGDFNLSHVIVSNMQEVDTNAKREIMTDTYNFYLKNKDASTDQELSALRDEAIELDKKYPFELCHVMVLELLNIIDGYVKAREG